MTVVASQGMMVDDLAIVRTGLVHNAALEVAPVQRQEARDFLALFDCTAAPLDLTLDHHGSGEASLIGYGLDRSHLLTRAANLVTAIGFCPARQPSRYFIATIESSLDLEWKMYDQLEHKAQPLQTSLHPLFYTVRYANFLAQYCGVPGTEALARASKRFNL